MLLGIKWYQFVGGVEMKQYMILNQNEMHKLSKVETIL